MDQIFNELHHIYSKHKKALQGLVSRVQALCEEAESLKDKISVIPNGNNLPTAQLEAVTTEAEQVFPQKVHAFNQAVQAEKGFSAEHNLTNKAGQPNPVVTSLLIAIGVFFDAGMNSSFLYSAHMVAGPFAALLVSFTFSLTIVVTCVCAGYFIGRFLSYGKNSTDPDIPEFKKIRSRARWQFRVFIGVMIFLLLTIGLIRSTESLDDIQHSLVHYSDLATTPEAVFLILLNICIAVFSFHKGRTGFAHPYGDYSSYQTAVINAREDLQQTYADYVEEIEDICEAVESDAGIQDKSQKKSIEQHSKKVSACHQAYRALEKAVQSAKSRFSAEITKIIHTQSVITGKSETLPDGLLEQFSFSDVTDIALPDFYQPPKGRDNKAALTKAKADALRHLSKLFKNAIQS
ncbi:MAG: hypothetical protein H6937_02570 [Burkholderiales bacterium]|nr:hypothetical protein [Burkholderiales bacterium]